MVLAPRLTLNQIICMIFAGTNALSITNRKGNEMKKLIVVRHAPDGIGDRISDAGRAQMFRLAERIARHVDGSLRLLTSTTGRARASAEVLACYFLVEIEEHEILWSERMRPMNLPGAFDLLHKKDADTIIVVTHQEYAEYLPGYVSKRKFGVVTPLFDPVPKGGAVVLDCEHQMLVNA